MPIMTVHELWNDGTVALGAAREVKMHMLVEYTDGRREWVYFGTTPPVTRPDAIVRPTVRFPAEMYDMPEGSDLTFDLAYEVARNLLDLASVEK